jgi:hypothetical protein
MFAQSALAYSLSPDHQLANRGLALFNRACSRARLAAFFARLAGQASHLLDVQALLRGRQVGARRYAGIRTVAIDQVVASEGRCDGFDRSFRPLSTQTRDRWLSIANAVARSVNLPVVDLIKVGDAYIVRDGHHRLSVYAALGRDYVEASVTEWVLG